MKTGSFQIAQGEDDILCTCGSDERVSYPIGINYRLLEYRGEVT